MSNLNSEWASLIVEELVRLGVDTFVGSPGSRSTPLVAAVARHPRARFIVHTDERGAAFYALGYARAKGRPAPFICTSGTALANAYPAVVEAYQDLVPMLLLTADRPPELIDCGANQSIRQEGIYGKHLIYEQHLPTPTRDIAAEQVLTLVDQAYYRTHAGPVQVNCCFRKPLEPGPIDPSYLVSVADWAQGNDPYTTYHRPVKEPRQEELHAIAERIRKAERPLLLLGRMRLPMGALDAFIQTLQWPTFPDILSGYRLGTPHRPLVHHFEERLDEWEPDLILHLGGPLLSAKLLEAIRRWQVPLIHVEEHERRHDPAHRVTTRFECDILRFSEALTWMLDKPRAHAIKPLEEAPTDHFCRNLSREVEGGDGLFLASSMSIRLMARHGSIAGPRPHIASNRGASGIDGTIASACGFAQGLRKPVTCLLGDLAFLHDVSSLPLVNKGDYPVRLVVLDDNGGGIFQHLPIAQHADLFEPYFRTPHHLDLEAIAKAYKVKLERIVTQEQK